MMVNGCIRPPTGGCVENFRETPRSSRKVANSHRRSWPFSDTETLQPAHLLTSTPPLKGATREAGYCSQKEGARRREEKNSSHFSHHTFRFAVAAKSPSRTFLISPCSCC